MKYWLRHITRTNLPRTILLSLFGLGIWGVSFFLHSDDWLPLLVTMILVVVNALIIMRVFYQSNVINLPTAFVPVTYWVMASALPALHTCWQGQLVVLGVLLACLTLLHIDYKHVPLEESFLSTLLLCCTALVLPEMLFVISIVWIYLLYRHVITWQVLAASWIAIATFVLYYAVACFLGWTTPPHRVFFQMQYLSRWIAVGQMVVAMIIIYLPIRLSSIGTGILYVLTMLSAMAGAVVMQVLSF